MRSTGETASTSMPRQRLTPEKRRAQIVAAAREIFIEQGIHGSRSRLIAERAGITEAYLYRHFHSKGELYRLAVEAPLEHLMEQLRTETHELALSEDVSRADVLLRCHELLLEGMVHLAPLIAAALFADPDPEHDFYTDYLFPKLRGVLESIIPDITGRSTQAFEVNLFVDTIIGIHLTLALEALLDNAPVDVKDVARQVTRMFAPGVSPRPDVPRGAHGDEPG